MPSFLIRELYRITVLHLICNFNMSRSTRFVSLKVCMDSPFLIRFRFFKSLYFISTKSMNSLTLKCHNSF